MITMFTYKFPTGRRKNFRSPRIFFLLHLVLATFLISPVVSLESVFNIGAVLTSKDHWQALEKIVADINSENEDIPHGVQIQCYHAYTNLDPIDDTHTLCTKLFPEGIGTLLVDDRETSNALAFTSALHGIPMIGLTNRESTYSDKSLYGTYLRTSSSYAHQADVWMEMLISLKFECVHFIVSDSINGRTMKIRFLELADSNRTFVVESVTEFNHRKPNLTSKLGAIHAQNSSCRVFALFCDDHNAPEVLKQIEALNMSAPGYVWLISEQAIQASTLQHLPVGFLAARYKDWTNVVAHMHDAIHIISKALNDLEKDRKLSNFSSPPLDCKTMGEPKWREGADLYERLQAQDIIFGKTGKLAFDERGDRLHGDFEIVNQQFDKKDRVNKKAMTLVPVGAYHFNKTVMGLVVEMDEQRIVWPGNSTRKPGGYHMPNHLRIATIAEAPFVLIYPVNEKDGLCAPDQVPCPVRKKIPFSNNDYKDEQACCTGYCIDLLVNLSVQMDFTFSLYRVSDGTYGTYRFDEETDKHIWTGLLGELHYGRADMVVAALTITPERSMAIDFTKPFRYQGITILQRRQHIHRLRHPLTSFLQPFQDGLWVSVFVSVHVVALSLYLLDRFSPFGRYKLPNCEAITEEDALNLSSAIWFAWGVLFNSGIGEGTPRSFSGRVLGIFWCGFAMIVVASYTANLAAFLVLDRPETALTGINDPRLRGGNEGFNYSTVRDSAVDLYFRRQVELQPMYKKMKDSFYDSAEEAIAAVKAGSLNAFLWDSARLEYEASNDCDMSVSGEHFGRSGYAIGLPKGQIYWREKLSMALLGMHEIGYMEDLDNKWILLNKQKCAPNAGNFPPTLGLKNMAGVFMLVGVGILGGIGLIMFEIFYKQAQTRKLKRMELARNAVDKWKEMVENRKILLESLNVAAKQRYRDRHQANKRRQVMKNSSKSFSAPERHFGSACSLPSGSNNAQNIRARNIQLQHTMDDEYLTVHGYDDEPTFLPPPPPPPAVKKPTFLDLKTTFAPGTPTGMEMTGSDFEPHYRPPSASRMPCGDHHPFASARIRHPTGAGEKNKPKLRREYSVGHEPEMLNMKPF